MTHIAILIIGIFAGFCIGVFAEVSKRQTQKELDTKIRMERMWSVIEAEIRKGKVN